MAGMPLLIQIEVFIAFRHLVQSGQAQSVTYLQKMNKVFIAFRHLVQSGRFSSDVKLARRHTGLHCLSAFSPIRTGKQDSRAR